MFMEASFKKLGKNTGLIRTCKALHAVYIGDVWSASLACKKFDDENTLYLHSYFISGYKGSNFAGEKGTANFNIEMIKAICELDKSFYVAYGKAISSNFDIRVIDFWDLGSKGEEYIKEDNK